MMNEFPALRTSVNSLKPWEQGGYREVDVEYDLRGPDLEVLKGLASAHPGLRATPGASTSTPPMKAENPSSRSISIVEGRRPRRFGR